MITAAAIRYRHKTWQGKNHSDIILHIVQNFFLVDPIRQDMQGFLTDTGQFLSRADAKEHTLQCNQLDEYDKKKYLLLSEMLNLDITSVTQVPE